MNAERSIVVVSDDVEDIEIISAVISELDIKNELKSFSGADELIDFLKTSDEKVLFILCDLNLPKITGLDLRQIILEHKELKQKSIPFLLWSTAAGQFQIRDAYEKLIQGFFLKPSSFEEIKKTFRHILDYWSLSLYPR